MFKPNNKKTLTVLITLAMVFSALAVISMAAQPAYATASGTVSYTPTTVTSLQVLGPYSEISTTGVYAPIIAATGGTFGSGTTVYFYWSTSNSASGIIPTAPSGTTVTYAFSTQLGASQVSLSNTVLKPNTLWSSTVSLTAGETIYLLASDTALTSTTSIPATAQFAGSVPFTVTTLAPAITFETPPSSRPLNYISAPSGSQILVGGSGFSPTASSVTFYMNGTSTTLFTLPVSSGIISQTLETVPTNVAAALVSGAVGYYGVMAVANTGESADGALQILPAVTLTPNVVGTTAGQTITVTGTGFAAGGWIQLDKAISITGVTESNAAVQVSAQGGFTVTATLTSTLTAGTAYTATTSEYTSQTGGSTISGASATNYLFASAPSYSLSTIEIYHSGVSPASSGSNLAGATENFVAFEFPASTLITLMVGPVSVENFTTNSYGGYAGTFVVPESLPSGSYTVTGVNEAMGVGAQTTASLTIEPSISVSMLMPGVSYLPNGYLEGETGSSQFNVTGYGFTPGDEIVLGSTATLGEVVLSFPSGIAGDFYVSPGQYVSLNGSFNITVYIAIDYAGFINGAPTPLTAYNDFSGGSATLSNAFYQYVSPTISVTNTNGNQLSAPYSATNPVFIKVTVAAGDTASSLHPLLPSTTYTLLFGNTAITTFTTDTSGNFKAIGVTPAPVPSSPDEIAFAVPNMPSGYYPINLEIGTTPINIINPQDSFYLITSPGSTPTVVIQDMYAQTYNTEGIPDNPAGVGVGHTATDVSGLGESINIFAYNFPAGSTRFAFFSADGLITSLSATAETSTGAYAMGGSAPYPGVSVNAVPGGTYLVSATASNSAYGTQVAAPANAALFTVVASLNAPKYSGQIGRSVSFYATGLAPNTNYVGVFNGQVLLAPTGVPVTYLSSSTGSVGSSHSPDYFTIPPVYVNETNGFSYYSFSLAPYTSPTTLVTTAPVKVLYPSTISISPTPAGYAFPGEIISFSWSPAKAPSNPVSPYGPITVTVFLNGAPYTTVPASYSYSATPTPTTTLSGSFLAPNAAPGTNYSLSFGWTQNNYMESSLSGSVLSSVPMSYTGNSTVFLGIVSGSGALVVGISSSSIATIITNAVNSAMKVPISELNASIAALNGTVVKLNTAFGTMQTTLSAINATVSSISSGVVLLSTELGTLKVSLASINATLMSVNGSVATLSTTLGKVQASLSSINATVTSSASSISGLVGSVATIQTSLGTISGTVTSINGTVATIQTSIGKLQTSVNAISLNTSKVSTLSSALSTSEVFEIVILVLVLITLVLSFLAISSVNRVAKKVEEQKKQ